MTDFTPCQPLSEADKSVTNECGYDLARGVLECDLNPPILHVLEPDLAELSGQQRHSACQWRLRPRSVNPGEDFDGKENEGMHYTRV
jgi:hypothetical protein